MIESYTFAQAYACWLFSKANILKMDFFSQDTMIKAKYLVVLFQKKNPDYYVKVPVY